MLGCLGEVADGLRGRVGWGRGRLRGSLRAIQPHYYTVQGVWLSRLLASPALYRVLYLVPVVFLI